MQYYGDLLRNLAKSNSTDVCEFFVKKCLVKAKSRSTNEGMKRFFMISVVSANDGLKELLQKNELVFSSYWAHRRYFYKVKNNVPTVVKAYLSCLLLVLSSQKALIFQKTGLPEEQLLALWCDIFKYNDSDMVYFNQLVKQVGGGLAGIDIVFEGLNEICHNSLNGGEVSNIPCNTNNKDFLMSRIGEDAYIIIQRLQEYADIAS